MSSRGKIFVIHTKIKSESAWVDQQFLSERRVTLYLKIAELMETCPQSIAFRNWNVHVKSQIITPEIPAMPQSRTGK